MHANALELPLFEKGYGRDASGIATDGIPTLWFPDLASFEEDALEQIG